MVFPGVSAQKDRGDPGPGPERGQTGEAVRHGSPFLRPVRGHRGRSHGQSGRCPPGGRSGVLLRPSQPRPESDHQILCSP